MTIYERLNTFLDYKNLNTSKFEQSCGLSNGSASKLSENTRRSTFGKISEAFPDLNIDWLKSGEGEMILNKNIKPYKIPETEQILVSDVKDNYKTDNSDYIPLLPVEAMAGTLQGLSEGVELANCRKIKSPVKGADWAIQISGDSMEPDYRNGSYLYIRKMRGAFIPWGHTMVVDTYDGVVVKNIYPIEGTEDYIEAKSINPKYPPFKIETSSILGFYRVLGGSFINSTV